MQTLLAILLALFGVALFLYSIYLRSKSASLILVLLLRGVGIVAVFAAIGMWGIASMPTGSSPAAANTSTEANATVSDASAGSPQDNSLPARSQQSAETEVTHTISSCDEYAAMKDELLLFDQARGELQGKNFEDTREASDARREIASSVFAYRPSSACQDFVEHVAGIAEAQIPTTLVPQSVDDDNIDEKALFNAASQLYGNAYASYCGTTAQCVPT